MSATAPIALASTVYPDVAAGLAALFLGATFLAFRRRFARFTLAQQDSFWGFGFPQTGTALAFTEVIVAVVSGGTVLWGIWVLALHFNPNQPTTNLRDVYRDLADVQREMDFQIVVPCWLPDSLNAQPTVEKLSSDTVELSYRSPAQLGLPLRIIEQSAEGLRLVRVGESVGIDGAEARLTDAPPGGEVALEFIKDDIRYDMVCSCGREAISMIARSMLSGCKEGG